MSPDLVLPKFIGIRDAGLDEKWLHERLKEHPEFLRLDGELTVRDSERRQPGGGRLDLLLEEPESNTRYEVEIQLGAVDESHIIRTIEYWDIERRRFPQYDHVGVIVAEDVTSRFLNVIALFNRAIPLIAIQMRLVEVAGKRTLISTRVLDLMPLGTEDEDKQAEAADQNYWKQKGIQGSLALVETGLALIRSTTGINVEPNYAKHYIGLLVDGSARNFVSFIPRKREVIAKFKIPLDAALSEELEDAGLRTLTYNRSFGQYQVPLTKKDFEKHDEMLRRLIQMAQDRDSRI